MITMKDIIRDGHPALRKRAKEVPVPLTKEDRELLLDMLEFLENSQDPHLAEQYDLRAGVGLAAPQLNISKRMFAVLIEDDDGNEYRYGLANPKIVSHSVKKAYLTSGEGCLSVDENIPGYVPRYDKITITGIDHNGNEVKLRLRGLVSIVFQHEYDHLNGVMFYDHIDEKDPFAPIPNSKPIGDEE
ncbi:peptide deformylase [Bacillus fonticola]|uniref:peptide deformylase n=1 Tax=Bacillus fonticola TaxID=2728853 RepID=UPI0014730495|nr:peptide deformylase [Bacillus fonticola]